MDVDRLLKLYKVRELIFEDKLEYQKLLDQYIKEREKELQKVFDSRATPHKNPMTQIVRVTIFTVEHLDETWEEYFQRKLSEDETVQKYRKYINVREIKLVNINAEIEVILEGKYNEEL